MLSTFALAKGVESERIYTLADVSAIDRENKLWRLVDPTESVEANIQRLLLAGIPVKEVEALKPRLVAIWVDLDPNPSLHLEWLDRKTMAKIAELAPEYEILMRKARVDEALFRLGGKHEPLTPGQIRARWDSAIWELLDLDERQEFMLLNSGPALALQEMTKNLHLTVNERRNLCHLQQDYLGSLQKITMDRSYRMQSREGAYRLEALLDFRQRMRDLLGDDRFAAYLQAADAGFARMSGVLSQVAGMNSSIALNLWWIRKTDELADVRVPWSREHHQQKAKMYDSACVVLGPSAVKVYEGCGDAEWLKRNKPYQFNKAGPIAQKASAVEKN